VTTRGFRTVTCSRCGTANRLAVITSTNQVGAPDLDVRPPPMLRNTIDCWIQDCTACGYVSSDIGAAENGIDAVLASDAYRALVSMGGPGSARLTSAFRRRAMIDTAKGERDGAGDKCLFAAWVADDAGDPGTAAACRREAAAHMIAHLAATTEAPVEYRLRLVDVLRRAGDFPAATDHADRAAAACDGDALLGAIIAFQKKLIAARDTGRHTVEDVHEGK